MKRKIFIGDIHGCYKEFSKLLKKVEYKKNEDELYLVGDLINRGPSSRKVFEIFQESGAKSILGNHEYFLLQALSGGSFNRERVDKIKLEFGELFEAYIEEIRSWPSYIEQEDFILVHAGVLPNIPLNESKTEDISTIRTWDGIGKDLQNPINSPWYEFYKEGKLIIFGHWAKLGGIHRDNIIGIDTGCVYGKKLSALVLPEKEIITVQAEKTYFPIS